MGFMVVIIVGLAMGALVTAAVQKVNHMITQAKRTDMSQQHIEYLK
jgi:hypothetical protein